MAGILPGVEMHRRIRAGAQRPRDDSSIVSAHRHHRLYRSWGELPQPAVVVEERSDVGLEEGAARARRRLEEKLRYCRHSRPNQVRANEARVAQEIPKMKDCSSHLVSKIIHGKPWKSNSNKPKEGICAVCWEYFGAGQQVMEFNCTHKFHSKCLLPWLASQRSCPTCRILSGPKINK